MRLLLSIFLSLNIIVCVAQNYLPKANGEAVNHTYYSLSYIEEHEQPEWVFYELKSSQFEVANLERTDKFITDYSVSTESASYDDYKSSGFDRGHLCPVASMSFDDTSMKEVFYMSNISPQYPSFNRGIWKRLEELVRSWAKETPQLYVVTGPILKPNIPTIGGDISIPESFYKIIYIPSKDEMIGFILPNLKTNQTQPLQNFVATVDSIELLTNIDFFGYVDLTEEESKVDPTKWRFTYDTTKQSSAPKRVSTSAQSTQCKGVTAAGTRCKKMTRDESGFCYLHKKD